MADLRLAVIVTGDGSGLKAVLRSAAGDVKAVGDAADVAAAKSAGAATKTGTAWQQANAAIATSTVRLGGTFEQLFTKIGAAAGNFGNSLRRVFGSVATTFGRMGPMIQGFGYQIGDFAVQVASGGGIMRPLIQQGSQLVSMFGPWGAVVGAAGASIGALAMAFGALEDPAAKAEAALEAFNKTVEHAQTVQKALRGEMRLTREAMEADARNTLAIQEAQLAELQRQLAKMPKEVQVAPRAIGSTALAKVANPTSAYAAAEKAVDEAESQTRLLKATLGGYDDGRSMMGTDNKDDYYKEQKLALDELVKSLQRDAELAGLSGKAHAERQAIMQAEAAAQRDFENHLRGSADLTTEERANVVAAADARWSHAEAVKASAAADRESQQALQQQQKAVEGATKAINDQIAGYDEELYQLNLSDRERFIRQGLLQAEQTAMRANTAVTQEQVEAIRQERGAIFDRNQVISDGKKAQQEATQAAEKASRDREQAAEREAELQLAPYKNAIQGLQSAWTDGWEQALSGNINSFSEFFSSVKQMAIRWAAEMVSLVTFRPAAGSIIGAIAPQLAGSLGLGGLSGQNAAASAAGSSGIFGSLKASAAPLAAMFGGAGGATSGLGSWLSQLLGTDSAVYSNGIQIGSSSPGWASFLNSGAGTGLVGAALSAGLTAASGGSGLQTAFSGGGALLGGLAGSIFGQPVIGSMLGGLAGNIIGGLFGGKDKKPPKQKSITSISALSNGQFGVGNTFTDHSADVSSGIGGDAANALNALLVSLGATVSGPLTGKVEYYGRTPRWMSEVAGVTNQFGDDEQGAKDAVADFMARTMIEAAKSDKLQGVSDAVKTAIANSGATDADALDAAIAFGKFYDRVDKIRTPADAAAAAIADLAAQMTKATSQADQYGLDVAKIPEIFKENFTDDIEQQILALKDPQQAALNEEEKAAAARIAQAQQLGADLAEVEELNALKRQQVLEQGLEGMSSTLQDFFNSLKTGSLSALSPEEQLRQARLDYDTAYKSGDATDFTQAASTLLTIARDFYASSKGYADIYRQVLTDTKQLGNLDTDLPKFAAGGDHTGGLRLVGEEGPELEATGPARYWDADKTVRMLQAANADFDQKGTMRLAEWLGRTGADGIRDNHLVHVNDNELQALYDMGGAGTTNPYTGLLEFGAGGGGRTSGGGRSSGGGRTSDGSTRLGGQRTNTGASAGAAAAGAGHAAANGGKGTAGGGGNSAINPGNQNLGLAGPDYSGPQGAGTGVDPSNPSNAPGKMSDKGGGGWDDSFGPAPTSPLSPDGFYDGSKVSLPNGTTVDADKFFHDWADYQGLQYGDLQADGFWDDVGNFFASLLGFNELNPLLDKSYNTPDNPAGRGADWSWDPAGLIGSAIGMMVGAPFGPGLFADWLSEQAGRPFAQLLGPSVIGDPVDAPVNDNQVQASSLNDSLNTQRAVALSAVQSSTLSGLAAGGGSFVDPSHLPTGVNAKMAATVAQQNQRIAALDASGQQSARIQQETLSVLKEIRNSQTSTQYWQTLTAARKKAP
jgi:hypothetical protein